ncbi:CG10029 [Drosophila busckii]|uniref:CG10029 n=2 Tax=Drosophila busckii TaxID=30019 RepID=A0A0M3QX62_DROBS|nr:CG10029 [Drosophila busckii]
MFAPIFDEAAQKLKAMYPEPGRLILGSVNCSGENELENQFDIGKYPTVKIVRHGIVARTEYRGQRSVDGLILLVYKELQDSVQEVQSMDELNFINDHKYLIVGYFEHKDLADYAVYRRAAKQVPDTCRPYGIFGQASMHLRKTGRSKIIIQRKNVEDREDYYSEYNGRITNFTELLEWINEECEVLVRELTFENAEEITEEGLPLVILFHDVSDKKSVLDFEKVIATELDDELDKVIFLTADADEFRHPLLHMGVERRSGPIIAADSFVHMFLFSNYEHLHVKGKLKTFVNDLISGELHRAYHLVEISAYETETEESNEATEISFHQEALPESASTLTPMSITKSPQKLPPESKFKALLPSKHRYTARDEL